MPADKLYREWKQTGAGLSIHTCNIHVRILVSRFVVHIANDHAYNNKKKKGSAGESLRSSQTYMSTLAGI